MKHFKKAKVVSTTHQGLSSLRRLQNLQIVPDVHVSPPAIHAVPPELCALIAHYATRSSTARISSSSRRLCTLFSPLLYQNILDPPLTSVQSLRLIETLNADECAFRTHPALLIQRLGLANVPKTLLKDDACRTALQNMHRLLPSSVVSHLRSLHWSVSSGIDILGPILGSSNFPNLKELFVSCEDAGDINTFTFMQKGGLEAFGLSLELNLDSPNVSFSSAERILFKLTESIQTLPLTSPQLRTLQLKLRICCEIIDALPTEARSDFLEALSGLRFSSLQNLDLCVECVSVAGAYGARLNEFVDAHPQLKNLAFNVPESDLTDLDDSEFFSTLRSFRGTAADATHLLEQSSHLEEVIIVHIHRWFFDPPSFRLETLPSLSTLTKFTLRAVDAGGNNVLKSIDEVSAISLKSLVASFPNLTHLDIPISDRLHKYRSTFARLRHLQELRLREYRIQNVPIGSLLSKVLPHHKYVDEIKGLLVSLPKLTDVAVCVLVDDGDMDDFFLPCGCRTDVYVARMLDPPEMRVEYEFAVLRSCGVSEVVLVHSDLSDKRTKRRAKVIPAHP
ncbi:hypothetical protein C8F01DRAFT_1105052 [Mycena amicta]|nr:hypothetical protein C8F01DRAFT_1105052 [Mycena amicta]